MAEEQILCSHCHKAIAPGDHAVALHEGEPRPIRPGEDGAAGACFHSTCYQIARVQRAIDDLGVDGE